MNLYDELAGEVMDLIRDEWDKQGHDMTGTFKESMRYEVKEEVNSTVIRFFDGTKRGYGIYLNVGVKASEIKYPYAKARIKGLTNFVEFRMGLEGDEAVSVAYAIATKHAKEGMPLPSSVKYSKTGWRTRFVQEVEGQIKRVTKEYLIEFINSKAAQRT